MYIGSYGKPNRAIAILGAPVPTLPPLHPHLTLFDPQILTPANMKVISHALDIAQEVAHDVLENVGGSPQRAISAAQRILADRAPYGPPEEAWETPPEEWEPLRSPAPADGVRAVPRQFLAGQVSHHTGS